MLAVSGVWVFFLWLIAGLVLLYFDHYLYYSGLKIHKRPQKLPIEYLGIFSAGELACYLFRCFTIPLPFLFIGQFEVFSSMPTAQLSALFVGYILAVMLIGRHIQRYIDRFY